MSATDTITQARLKELLEYDPETGLLTWLQRPSNRIKVGDIAGCPDKYGYIVIRLDGVLYKAHRLIFLYMEDWMPVEVDHDDHVRDNNRWANLNPATRTTNGKNCTLRYDNTSGVCGVYWNKQLGKWAASIRVDDKNIHLGLFTELSDAIAARETADIKYGFHSNHGSN